MKQKLTFTYWRDGDWWLGYLDEFPDHWTQGESLEELKVMLADLYKDLTSGEIAGIRHRGEMELELA
ncbi:MAG: type II toxin-antitoxin system HicB family antitoxin [Prosthecobacter sp.]|jgi:predicted RNase H-like HicB family nuclease|uniref:hypothetical protein n=1 Tax=Prosthecobacter sp. TaxID=1965333 RepID=UPI0019F90CA0|nr:hypothetical protein [Prosthecobacter sp.]MBE2284490.1 type II toxin-antitoxin system HicB family antitoxin [Prosthecobacter sp.]